MVDPETYITEGLVIVKKLLKEKDFHTALRACEELLKVNPYHRKVQKYLHEIESEIVAANEKKVDADIEATMPLWKEGRFDDLLKIYTKLYQFAPNHPRLRKLIAQLNERLSKEKKSERQGFIDAALAAIRTLMKEEKYTDAIQASGELLTIDPTNAQAEELKYKAKDAYIERELRANERLIDSADFERAIPLYERLLTIQPEHLRVKKLLAQAQGHLAEQQMIAAKIHLNESIARMKELFKTAEYEKVIQACIEIERLSPKNFSARMFHKKALRTIEREVNALSLKKMKEQAKELEEEYRKNPASFIKI